MLLSIASTLPLMLIGCETIENIPNSVRIGFVYILYVIAIIVGVFGFFHVKNFALTLKDGFTWWGLLWKGVGLIGVGLIIMVILFFSLAFICPHTNKKVAKDFAHDSITTELATLPAPPIAAPAPKTIPTPASGATQHTTVIGNSDSKRYHLPGMKYYDTVKAYHRVEFDSEADAIKAGYNKASR